MTAWGIVDDSIDTGIYRETVEKSKKINCIYNNPARRIWMISQNKLILYRFFFKRKKTVKSVLGVFWETKHYAAHENCVFSNHPYSFLLCWKRLYIKFLPCLLSIFCSKSITDDLNYWWSKFQWIFVDGVSESHISLKCQRYILSLHPMNKYSLNFKFSLIFSNTAISEIWPHSPCTWGEGWPSPACTRTSCPPSPARCPGTPASCSDQRKLNTIIGWSDFWRKKLDPKSKIFLLNVAY